MAEDLGLLSALVEQRARPSALPATSAAPAAPAPLAVRSGAPGTVLDHRLVTPDLLVLRIARPPGLGFEPGQHVSIGVGDASHPYSIASAPADPFLEFAIELVPGGRLTPRLFALAPGDAVRVGKRAKGSLVLDASASDHLMFATVTGVAPFVGMLRQELRAPKPGRRFLLLHGASVPAELVFHDELVQIAAALPSFEYVPAVSRPEDPRSAGWTGEQGRLPSIANRWAERFDCTSGRCTVYACGHPAMVAAIEAQLEQPGIEVRTEAYWD